MPCTLCPGRWVWAAGLQSMEGLRATVLRVCFTCSPPLQVARLWHDMRGQGSWLGCWCSLMVWRGSGVDVVGCMSCVGRGSLESGQDITLASGPHLALSIAMLRRSKALTGSTNCGPRQHSLNEPSRF